MTNDELVEKVVDVLVSLDSAFVDYEALARAAIAIAMPAAFEMFGEAVKDGTCQCEACIDILVRKEGEKWK